MKKLKRFTVKSMSVLTPKEMALIHGGRVIDALSKCTPSDANLSCIYGTHIVDGHTTYIIGTCYVTYRYDAAGNMEVDSYGCR